MSSDTRSILVVSGLAVEGNIAAGSYTICVASPPTSLAAKLNAISDPISGVLSFGICGGIDTKLYSGSIVVPDEIVTPTKSFATTREFSNNIRETLQENGLAISAKSIACTAAPVLTVAEKAALREATKCIAVDTESHIAAAYAARRGLPFAAIRVVCDTAGQNLPPLAIRAIGPAGNLDWKAIGREFVQRPGQLLQLPGTALATAKALKSLRRVRRCLGPHFGL